MTISEQDDLSDTKLCTSTTTSSKEKSDSCEKHPSTDVMGSWCWTRPVSANSPSSERSESLNQQSVVQV